MQQEMEFVCDVCEQPFNNDDGGLHYSDLKALRFHLHACSESCYIEAHRKQGWLIPTDAE